MPGAFSGAIIRRYTKDISALPGQVTQARHDARTDDSAPEDNRDRDLSPAGGGWTPDEWLYGQVPVGAGDLAKDRQRDDTSDHRASGSHTGADAGGMARWVGQDDDKANRQDGPQNPNQDLRTAGAGGAAFGGLRKTGSMLPEANPGGVDLGHFYNRPEDTHPQRLHFNRPGLRLIRQPSRNSADYVSFGQNGGPSQPRLRRQIRPAGQTDFLTVDQTPAGTAATLEREHGSIGGEWAL